MNYNTATKELFDLFLSKHILPVEILDSVLLIDLSPPIDKISPLQLFDIFFKNNKKELLLQISETRQSLLDLNIEEELIKNISIDLGKTPQDQDYWFKKAKNFYSIDKRKQNLLKKLEVLTPMKHWFLDKKNNLKGPVSKEMITRAKHTDIKQLIIINRQNRCICPFHDDKDPSAHYYENQNKLYCFVCKKSIDSITLYQKLNNCDFKTAVRNLCTSL